MIWLNKEFWLELREEESLSPLEEGTGNSGGLKARCDITHEEN